MEANSATPAGSPQAPPANALDGPPSGTGGQTPGTSPGGTNPAGATPGSTPSDDAGGTSRQPAKKQKFSKLRRILRHLNLYLLSFVLLVIVAGAYTVVSYLNSKKPAPTPSVATQELNQNALSQLASADAAVGGSGKTLTVQGNAILAGQVLAKSDLGVAGTIQAGAGIIVPQITVSGNSNLGTAQINTLQVAQTTTMQGMLTLQSDLNVAGSSSFSGPITAGQITVTRLIMSGNASLQVPNHISFPGASPGRTINPTVLGAGGSTSVNGSDTTGTVSVNTGSGTVAGCFATLTFNQRFTSTPHVIISPVGAGAGQTQYYVDRNTNGFSVCTANAAPANQTFAFDYFVTQ